MSCKENGRGLEKPTPLSIMTENDMHRHRQTKGKRKYRRLTLIIHTLSYIWRGGGGEIRQKELSLSTQKVHFFFLYPCYQVPFKLLKDYVTLTLLFRLYPCQNTWTLGHDIYFVSDLLIEIWTL